MAGRSVGVVLIVALLGWTVNQPIWECQGPDSRAAVVVLAGASPAHQPEPSPSRHNPCPHESEEAKANPPASRVHCSFHSSMNAGCCSISNDANRDVPAGLVKGWLFAEPAISSAVPARAAHSRGTQLLLEEPTSASLRPCTSSAVLRL